MPVSPERSAQVKTNSPSSKAAPISISCVPFSPTMRRVSTLVASSCMFLIRTRPPSPSITRSLPPSTKNFEGCWHPSRRHYAVSRTSEPPPPPEMASSLSLAKPTKVAEFAGCVETGLVDIHFTGGTEGEEVGVVALAADRVAASFAAGQEVVAVTAEILRAGIIEDRGDRVVDAFDRFLGLVDKPRRPLRRCRPAGSPHPGSP